MATPETIDIRFGFPSPTQDSMDAMWREVTNIWPELEEHRNRIQYVYTGTNSSYSFHKRTAESVAEEIRYAYNNGKKNIMFECLAEGVFTENIFRIDSALNLVTDIINDISVFYLSGAHDAKKSYDDICIRENLPRDRIKILACAGQESANRKYIYYHREYVPGKKSKKFLCFNKVCRQHRLDLFNEMLKADLVKDAFYSFIIEDNLIDVIDNHSESIYQSIVDIRHSLPLVLNITSDRTNPVDVRDEDLKYFDNSYFSVVTETLFFDFARMKPYKLYLHLPSIEAGIFPTEKIYKCIALGHPFVVASTRGFLRGLRERGYKTFSPFINESYDDIEDDDERFDAIVKEIKRLCSLSEDQLIEFTYKVKDIVEHNAKVFREVSNFRITENVVEMLK